MKKKKGFTLVELLVVIAILAILATAGIVGYTAFTSRAKESNLKSELTQLRMVIIGEDGLNDAFAIGENAITFDTTSELYYKNGSTYITKQAYDELADKTGYAKVDTASDVWQAVLSLNSDLKYYVDGSIKELEYADGRVSLRDNYERIVVIWTIGQDEITVGNYS